MNLYAWFYPEAPRLSDPLYLQQALDRLHDIHASGLFVMVKESEALVNPKPTQALLTRLADEGLDIHLGFMPFSIPPAPTPEMLRRRYTYREGHEVKYHGLCPAWPENRLLAVHRATQLCETLQATALHLDYIRYYFANSSAFGVNLEWEDGRKWIDTYHRCQCPLCQTDRLELLGREPTPYDEHHPAYIFQTLQNRAQHIDEVLRNLRKLTQNAGMRLSAAVRVQYANRALIEGQDWPRWCREGLLDTISPMNYGTTLDVIDRRLQENKRLLTHVQIEVLEGLGKRSSAGDNTAAQLACQVQRVMERGVEGVALFHLDHLTDEDIALLGSLQ